MENLKFSEWVHLDRNDETKPQSIYFDVNPKRESLIREVVRSAFNTFDNPAMSQAFRNEQGQVDSLLAYGHITAEVERWVGPMTVHELLCVTWFVSKYDAYREGFFAGIQAGIDQAAMSFHQN